MEAQLAMLQLEYDEILEKQATLQTNLNSALVELYDRIDELLRKVPECEDAKSENDGASMKAKLEEAVNFAADLSELYKQLDLNAKQQKDSLVGESQKLKDEVNALKTAADNSEKKRVAAFYKLKENFKADTKSLEEAFEATKKRVEAKQEEIDNLSTLFQLSIITLPDNIEAIEKKHNGNIDILKTRIDNLERAQAQAQGQAEAEAQAQVHPLVNLILTAIGTLAGVIGVFKIDSKTEGVWTQVGVYFVGFISLTSYVYWRTRAERQPPRDIEEEV